MKRFLSIDWDFFIDATMEQRCLLFPDGGNENLPDYLREFIWDSRYRHPDLKDIKVSSEYNYFYHTCRKFSNGQAFVADSHKWMYYFVMNNTEPDEEFEVYNIDFHHDLYNFQTSGGEVNCGNWATLLRRDRPNMKYMWVKRLTSDVESAEKRIFGVEMMNFQAFRTRFRFYNMSLHFSYLFICRSAVWSPPHLDPEFVKAVKALKCKTAIEQGLLSPRPFDIPKDFSEFQAFASLVKDAQTESED